MGVCSLADEEFINLVRESKIVLILDEVADIVQEVNISVSDVEAMLRIGLIAITSKNRLKWLSDSYNGKYNKEKAIIQSGNVVMIKKQFLFWTFPHPLFEGVADAYILTYMFPVQMQRYYFDLFGIKYQYFEVVYDKANDAKPVDQRDYILVPHRKQLIVAPHWKDLIEIINDEKANKIGKNTYALSNSWYNNAKQDQIKTLIKNMQNLRKNRWGSHAANTIWTTFKAKQKEIESKGFVKSFVPVNTRGTNKYKACRYCMYLCNHFYPVPLKNHYFAGQGITVNEDGFALSELVQWLWRSAIRDREKIYLYISSQRMRDLLITFLNGQFSVKY